MRPIHVLLVAALAAACGGGGETPKEPAAAAETAASEPQFEGKTFADWCATLESPATSAQAAAALRRLSASDARALPALVKALSHRDASVRDAASNAIAQVGEPAVTPVEVLLGAPDAATRDAAGATLVRLGRPGLRRLVVALGVPDASAAQAAATALQKAGDAAIEPLVDGLKFAAPATSAASARCLVAMRAGPALVAALEDPGARAIASDALVSMGADALAPLAAAASDPKLKDAVAAVTERVRVQGAGALVAALGDASKRAWAKKELTSMGEAAVPALVAGLGGESDAVRSACAEVLLAASNACAAQVAPLLRSPKESVRRAAAELLIRQGSDAATPLVNALGDDDRAVSDSVLAALRDAGSAGLPTLAAALDRGNEKARGAARTALIAAGIGAVPVLEEVATKSSAGRTAAVQALASLEGAAAPALVRLIGSADPSVRDATADVLGGAGPVGVTILVAALGRADWPTQSSAARGLLKAGAAAVAPLVEALASADAGFAGRAADLVGRLGDTAVPELRKAMSSPSAATRAAAARAMGAIAETSDAPIGPLTAALKDEDQTVRAAAARGLGVGGSRAKPALAALTEAMRDKSALVRVEAATSVIRVGGPAATATPLIVAGLRDKSPDVRRAALRGFALAGIAKDKAVTALVTALRDADVAVRMEAIGVAAAMNLRSDDVAAAVAQCTRSSDAAERTEALAALPGLSHAPIGELLRVGGPYRGDRLRKKSLESAGGSAQTEAAVAAALDWFARHQSPDGRWDCDGFDAQCKLNRCDGPGATTYDPGVSGLALLCFLGAGETPASGPHNDTVRRGLKYLRDIQDSEGCLGPRTSQHFLYNHAIGTIALCEASMLTGDPEIGEAADRAVGFVLKTKNPYLAWRYNYPPDGDNDTSITGWMSYALAVARASGIRTDDASQALKDARVWIDKMTEPEFGRTGYQQRGGNSSRNEDMAEKFPVDKEEALTSMAVMVRVFSGSLRKSDEFINKGGELIVRKLPDWDEDLGRIDFVYWFWGSLAARQVGGDVWNRWNAALKSALVDHQRREKNRDEFGSWNPIDAWSGVGGRVYSTALCCLCLETYYRMDQMPEGK